VTPYLSAAAISSVSSKRRNCTEEVCTEEVFRSFSRSRSASAISPRRRISGSGYSIMIVALKWRPSGTHAVAERFYNRFRRHSSIGYQTPVGKELGHQAA
jgi:transposase InsO family protein